MDETQLADELDRLATYIDSRLNGIGYIDYRTVLQTVQSELASIRKRCTTDGPHG